MAENLFKQAEWERRGENDARLADLTTRLVTAEAELALIDSGAWTSWTPTLANMTGTPVCVYQKIGRGVYWKFGLIIATMGSAPTFTLPFTAAWGANDLIGEARLRDIGTADYKGLVVLSSATVAAIKVNRSDGTYVAEADITSSVPHVWAGGTDSIVAQGFFEATS